MRAKSACAEGITNHSTGDLCGLVASALQVRLGDKELVRGFQGAEPLGLEQAAMELDSRKMLEFHVLTAVHVPAGEKADIKCPNELWRIHAQLDIIVIG